MKSSSVPQASGVCDQDWRQARIAADRRERNLRDCFADRLPRTADNWRGGAPRRASTAPPSRSVRSHPGGAGDVRAGPSLHIGSPTRALFRACAARLSLRARSGPTDCRRRPRTPRRCRSFPSSARARSARRVPGTLCNPARNRRSPGTEDPAAALIADDRRLLRRRRLGEQQRHPAVLWRDPDPALAAAEIAILQHHKTELVREPRDRLAVVADEEGEMGDTRHRSAARPT